jgi:hypothetical protein
MTVEMKKKTIYNTLAILAPAIFLACADSQQQFTDAAVSPNDDAAVMAGDANDQGPLVDMASPTDAGIDAAPCKLINPYSTKNEICNTCAEEKCCVEINECLTAPQCDDLYVNCILACALLPDNSDAGVPECVAQCGTDYPDGKAGYLKAIGCADTKCAAVCD